MSDENVLYYQGGIVEDKTVTKVVIATGVTTIHRQAFERCKKLQSVDFEEPCQVKKIDRDAFRVCKALNSIQLPESLLQIGNGAFWDCPALRRIVIPGGVTSIGWCAFEHCGIEDVFLSDGVKSIELEAFCSCPRLHTVRFPASLKAIRRSAFSDCHRLDNVIVPADGLPLLKSLDLHGSYQSRGWEAMCKVTQKAPNLTSLSLHHVTVGGCKLDDSDSPLVIEMVSSCPHLESLDLSYNEFSDQAIRTLDSEGILGRLREVIFWNNSDTENILSANEFLNLLKKYPCLAIWTHDEWEHSKDGRLIHHYLDMNRFGFRGVPVTNVSIWPRLIDRLGKTHRQLNTSPANVIYHLLHAQNNDLCSHYQQNRTKWHPDWEKRTATLKKMSMNQTKTETNRSRLLLHKHGISADVDNEEDGVKRQRRL